jgi:hypothetical protein
MSARQTAPPGYQGATPYAISGSGERAAESQSPLVIVVELVGRGRYRARLDGRVIVASSRQPFVDAGRHMPTNIAKLARDIVGWGPGADIGAMLAKHYPHATDAEIERAIEAAAHELEAEAERQMAQADALERLMALVGKLEPGQTIGQKLRIMAARGDKRAQRILDSWNTRERRVSDALFEAAAAKHPDWRQDGNAWRYRGPTKPEDDPAAQVIDWFQRTHPREARRIEDETR